MNQRDHFFDIVRRTRHDVWARTTERVEVLPQGFDVLRGVIINGKIGFLRAANDFVFDIGDVHDVHDFVMLETQCAREYVGEHHRTKIADVREVIHGRTAEIEADFAFVQRLKIFEFAGERVVKLEHYVERFLCVRRFQMFDLKIEGESRQMRKVSYPTNKFVGFEPVLSPRRR